MRGLQDATEELLVTIRSVSPLDVEKAAWLGQANTGERFGRRISAYRALFDQVLAIGPTITQTGLDPETRAVMSEAVRESRLLGSLTKGLEDGLSCMGVELGMYFYGGQRWGELCRYRSVLEYFRELVVVEGDLEEQLDLAWVDDTLAQWGIELFEDEAAPPRTPASHWWWFHEAPPTRAR